MVATRQVAPRNRRLDKTWMDREQNCRLTSAVKFEKTDSRRFAMATSSLNVANRSDNESFIDGIPLADFVALPD